MKEFKPDKCLSSLVSEHFKHYLNVHINGVMPSNLYHNVIEDVEITLINETLTATKGNQLKAAEILGINRNTLRAKILQHKNKSAKQKSKNIN